MKTGIVVLGLLALSTSVVHAAACDRTNAVQFTDENATYLARRFCLATSASAIPLPAGGVAKLCSSDTASGLLTEARVRDLLRNTNSCNWHNGWLIVSTNAQGTHLVFRPKENELGEFVAVSAAFTVPSSEVPKNTDRDGVYKWLRSRNVDPDLVAGEIFLELTQR